MEIALSQVKHKFLPLLTATLFVLFTVMLPRYTDTAKIWFMLLILLALVYLLSNPGQLQTTRSALRWFFAIVVANFLWIALSYYANGEPGRGDAFLWGRHFYFLFLIPLYFLFRRIDIPDRVILYAMIASVLLSFGDILVDLVSNEDHRVQGMNPNAFGPIQLCLAGILFFYYYCNPEKQLRWLALAGSLAAGVNVVFSMSRTTWVAMIVMIFLVTWYLSRRLSFWKKTGLLAAVVLILAASYSLPIIQDRVDHGVKSVVTYFSTDEYRDPVRLTTAGKRLELWKTGWKIFLENPLLGAGVGGFNVEAEANWERYQVNQVVQNYKYVHNQYIAALATRGFPGLLLFLLVILMPVYIAVSTRPATPTARLAGLSILFIAMTYLIGCLAEDHFEGKSAIMFTGIMLPLLLARLDPRKPEPGKEMP